jgi:hypothetical protein
MPEADLTFQIDDSLDWTDHFVEHGFAVAKGLVDPAFCEEAVERLKVLVDDPRPLEQWTTGNPGISYQAFREQSDPVLRKIYEQPRLLEAIATMHGGPGHWNRRETFYFLVKPYEPDVASREGINGHVDFGNQHIPILYRGFAMFVLLADNEPLSGNTIAWPGTHRTIQKQLMADPTMQQPSAYFDELQRNLSGLYEFVGKAGDVMFMHHLLFHAGSDSYSANRIPRLALLCDAWRDQWVTEIDPATPGMAPWLRSLSLNGAYKTVYDERAERAKVDKEVRGEIEAEQRRGE